MVLLLQEKNLHTDKKANGNKDEHIVLLKCLHSKPIYGKMGQIMRMKVGAKREAETQKRKTSDVRELR